MCHMGTVETFKDVKILRTIKHFDFEQNIFISDAVSKIIIVSTMYHYRVSYIS